jgi:hypothetical protein
MQELGEFMDSIPWYELVPSELAGMRKLVTAGTGSYASIPHPGDGATGGDDWVTSAATPDGRYLVAYIPHAHGSSSITIDTTILAGTADAKWFDPSSGAYTNAGRVDNTSTHKFSPPGRNGDQAGDWVLLVAVP